MGILIQIASLFSGLIGGAIGTVIGLLKGGLTQLMAFHEESIAFARDMGMSAQQANAYTRALTKNTKELAHQYGVTSEHIKAIQRGISEATNRQLMLNRSQVEGFTALSKLAGQENINKFAETMMNKMGAQIDTVENAVSKAYATAAKSGLAAKKITAEIGNNLSMMNRLSFKNGVDGLTKMAMQAEKVGMSLQSVETVASRFRDINNSIETAAQLQMLGGAAGAIGSNPLDMMYESNYDPEALQDRMIKMLQGYATFDEKSGMSNINGLGMDFVRNIADALHLSEKEVAGIAKKNAELKFKQERFGGNFSNFSQEQQDFIMNKSYVRDGQLYINDASGNEHNITNGSLDSAMLKELTQYDNKSDKEIMVEQAQTLTSINEQISGFWESLKATFGEKFLDVLPKIQDFIEKNGPKFLDIGQHIANVVGDFVNRMFTKENFDKVSSLITSMLSIVRKVVDIASSIWHWLPGWGKDALIAIAAINLLPGGGKVLKLGASVAKSAVKGIAKGGTKLVKSFAGSAGTWGKRLIRAGKGLGVGTLGAIGNMATDWAVEKGYMESGGTAHKVAKVGSTALEYGGMGAAIGSVVPIIGTGVGAAIGGTIGAVKGYLDASGLSVKEAAEKLWEGTKEKFSNIGETMSNLWDGTKETASKLWNGTKTAVSNLGQGLSSAWEFAKEKVPKAVTDIGKFFLQLPIKIGQKILKFVTDTGKLLKAGFSKIAGVAKKAIQWLADNNPLGLAIKGLGKIFGQDWSISKIFGFGDGGEGHARGGIVGEKDDVVGISRGEIVLSKTMQENLVSLLKSPGLNVYKASADGVQAVSSLSQKPLLAKVSAGSFAQTESPVIPKPVGEKEYIYRGENTSVNVGSGGNNTVTVSDFNININGTLKLDGGNSSSNIDVASLLKDPNFISQIRDVISNSVSSLYNGGRKMNDLATLRGLPAQTTTWGRRG